MAQHFFRECQCEWAYVARRNFWMSRFLSSDAPQTIHSAFCKRGPTYCLNHVRIATTQRLHLLQRARALKDSSDLWRDRPINCGTARILSLTRGEFYYAIDNCRFPQQPDLRRPCGGEEHQFLEAFSYGR